MRVRRNVGRRGWMGWTTWIQKETLMRENWKFGRKKFASYELQKFMDH